MTQRLELGSVSVPFKIFISSGGLGVGGVTNTDLALLYHDGAGLSGVLDETVITLQEIDGLNFPGEYLLKDYEALLTVAAGIAKVKWSGSGFDDDSLEVEVSEDLAHLRFLYHYHRNDLVWNPGDDTIESRWELYDDTSPTPLLMGYWLAQDAQGSEAIISGTGPATRRAFVAV